MGYKMAHFAPDPDSALRWHLLYNHFPPIDTAFIPVAKQAIAAASAGEWDKEVELTVEQIVEWMHLEPFINSEEDE